MGSWGRGDRSSRAQSHMSSRSPGPPRRPHGHTCVPGLKAGGGWAARSQGEHGTSSEVWASPASFPAPETLPRAAAPSRERGPESEVVSFPSWGEDGPPCGRAPRCQRPCSGRPAEGPHAVGTSSAPGMGLQPPGRASCPSSLLQPLGLALERAGCWRGDSSHGQSASLCPGFVSDFTLSEGLHVSCVRLSGDESPRAGHTEPTHQPGLRGQPPPTLDPACKCPEGPACSRDCTFFRPVPSSPLGEQEARPSVTKPAGGARPLSAELELGQGRAWWPRVLQTHGSVSGSGGTPALRSCVQSAGRSAWLASRGGCRRSFLRVPIQGGGHLRPCRAGLHNFRKPLSSDFLFEGQFTFYLMGHSLIPEGPRSRVI